MSEAVQSLACQKNMKILSGGSALMINAITNPPESITYHTHIKKLPRIECIPHSVSGQLANRSGGGAASPTIRAVFSPHCISISISQKGASKRFAWETLTLLYYTSTHAQGLYHDLGNEVVPPMKFCKMMSLEKKLLHNHMHNKTTPCKRFVTKFS